MNIFQIMSECPTSTAWSDEQIATLETVLKIVLPASYRALLRYTDPERLFECGNDLVFLQELKDELGGQAIFGEHAFIFDGHEQGYACWFFRADGSEDDPPVMQFIEGNVEPLPAGMTISKLIELKVRDWIEAT